jgi:hypothetical protein
MLLKTVAESVYKKLTKPATVAKRLSIVAENTKLKTGPPTNILAINNKSKRQKTYNPKCKS